MAASQLLSTLLNSFFLQEAKPLDCETGLLPGVTPGPRKYM